MKASWLKMTFLAALVVPVSLMAQDEKKTDNGDKDKKETQQVIITRNTSKDEKVVIEINGDKVTVNGKSIDEYKDKNGDITVRFNKFKNFDALTRVPGVSGNWSVNGNGFKYFNDDNRPMLGVTTEKVENGAKINSVTKDGAAEKIGLKEGDIITKVGDTKIEDADDLSAAVRKNKPGDKVEITYLRDKKEQKATAELTKWKGQNFNIDMKDMKFDVPPVALKDLRVQGVFRTGNSQKLGLSVQDTDDGKGVKVIEVDEESTASKAGIKEGDIITSIDGTSVNSTDEIVKIIRDSKEKISVSMKLLRNGKSQTIDVKMPRKIKTADL